MSLTNIPKTIFLNIGMSEQEDTDFGELSEVTWSQSRVDDTDIEYELKQNAHRDEGSIRVYEHQWCSCKAAYITAAYGLCKVDIYTDRVAELTSLIVYPEARGNGYGDKIIDKAAEVARKAGCTHLVLWPDCEDWVMDWYRRKGFTPNARFRSVRDNSIGWAKQLTEI